MSNIKIENKNGVTLLLEDDICWMSDTPKEKAEMKQLSNKCFGKVLVGGLGLGIVANYLDENTKVIEIVIVEKSQDVIDLIKPRIEKLSTQIFCYDIKQYLKECEIGEYDCIVLDTWKGIDQRSYEFELLPLKRWAKKITSNVFCWAEDRMEKIYG